MSSNAGGVVYQLRRIGQAATHSEVADVFRFEDDVTLIGRSKNNVQFFIDSSKHKGLISRIHARISKSKTPSGKDIFRIFDTSLNGTYVNDIKISNEAFLRPGDTVAFGHLQGATLQMGHRYQQPNSEFLFKFEHSPAVPSSLHKSEVSEHADRVENSEGEADYPLDHLRTPGVPGLLDIPIFLETPTLPLSLLSSSNDTGHYQCSTKRDLVKMFDENDSEADYKILKDYASAAALAASVQSDSDNDLFSDKFPNILPGGATEMWNDCKTNRSPEKKRRRKKETSKSKNTCIPTANSDNPGYCSAEKCLKPCEKLISWVQCDDCDQWYHIKCAGITFKKVQQKNTKFHCGCI